MLKYAFNLFDGGFGIILPEIEDKCHWQPEEIRGKPSEFWRRKLECERCLYHNFINHLLYVKVFFKPLKQICMEKGDVFA